MPAKGYRKGQSDRRSPLKKHLQTYLADDDHAAFLAHAEDRNLTESDLLRRIVQSHLKGHRAELPHRHANAAVLRELTRIGNNLNQLARQANTGVVPIPRADLERALAAVMDAVDRL